MTGPESPPLRSVSRVSIRRPPLSLPRPWHLMQLASKIGLISFVKSIRWLAGGGSCATWSGVMANASAGGESKRKNHFARRCVMRLRIYSKSKKTTGGKRVANPGEKEKTGGKRVN